MKVLTHICCGPCFTYPAKIMQEEGIELHGLFFNPNIHPIDEYEKRKENARIFCEKKHIPFTVIDLFQQDLWEKYSYEDKSRCSYCYAVRLDKAAQYAKENSFDAFTTSLLVSPYQKHDMIIDFAKRSAEKYDIDFFYRDFREGFREGQQIAKEIGLYRQKYCGCIHSEKEAEELKKKGKNISFKKGNADNYVEGLK